MNKKSIGHKKLISQCLSLLPTKTYSSPLLNYGYDKLSVEALMKIFVAAQLGKWESYEDMEERIRANPEFSESLHLPSISGSQLSRRINDLPTELAQDLFIKVVQIIQDLTKEYKGVSPELGRLKIIDSTHLKLPPELCDWAYVTNGWNVVKMHTRLVVVSEDVCYPDKILPSTGNMSDYESSDDLIEESDSTYLMDRGYPSTKNLIKWLELGISFVARITKNLKVFSLEEYEIHHPAILRDSKVLFGTSEKPVRLVEFQDEQKRVYRLMTTRWDLTAEQIMDLYRYRWMIETFFRWVKQHLKLVKIWSTKPQGMWNQMFMALAAYGLALILQLQTKTTKKLWPFLRLLRTYMDKSVEKFMDELFREKGRTSRGRQKIPITKKKETVFKGTVVMIKPKKKKK
jgi:hypothetical protein